MYRNISACKDLSTITSTSFGPLGRNKLVVNQLDKLFLTNDAGTILREIEVIHPAAKLILLAAQQQEEQMGDASNFVVTFAGELLIQAEELLRIGVNGRDIIEGYELAHKKAQEMLQSKLSVLF